jgi:hypothetical protein
MRRNPRRIGPENGRGETRPAETGGFMAKETEPKQPPMFRCGAVRQVGASQDGGFAFIEMLEVSGQPLALAFPGPAATELANRIMQAGDLALAQQRAADPQTGERELAPAPLVTEHTVVPAADGDTILMTLLAGPIPLMVRLSESRSQKLRASLERCEGQITKNKSANDDASA